MPGAIINLLGGSTGVLGSAALSLVGINVGGGLIGKALGIGKKNKPSAGQLEIREAVGSRRRHYGIVHTSGQVTFAESADGRIGKVLTLGTGREGDILEHRLYDRVVTLDGSGTVTGASFHGAIHIYTRSGTDDQTAISELSAAFAQWTSDHRQRGCAHVAIVGDAVKQERFSEVYNGQQPTYSQVRKAGFLYDPRLDSTAGGTGPCRLNDRTTWPWSDNGALVTADYVANEDGFALGYANVNWANIAAEADICDQTVTTVTAETIKRWRIWASYSLVENERRQVLTDMLAAIDGFCWQDADGLFNLKVGRWEEPDTLITDDHILRLSADYGPPGATRARAVKTIYTEAAVGYREQECATIADPLATDDPNTDAEQLEAYYAPHHNQASRLGKLKLADLSDRWRLTAVLNLYGLNLIGQRFTRLDSTALGVAVWARIDDLQLDLVRCVITAQLTQVLPEDWDFDAELEEGDPPLAPDTSFTPPSIDTPTGLSLGGVEIALGEVNAVAIEASWDNPGRDGFAYEVQYRPSAGGTWIAMWVDSDTYSARSGTVSSGVEYEVRVRALTISGRASAWSASEVITPSASATIGAPTALSATGGAGEADVTFSMPVSAELDFARLYSGTSTAFGSATQVGSNISGASGALISINHTGLAAGTRYYWARAFNTTGGSSALAGPVAATIT